MTTHDADGRAKVLSDGDASRRVRFREGADTALVWVGEGLPASNGGNEDAADLDVGTEIRWWQSLSILPSIPVAGMALILGVDRFMSECRALTSFVGNAVATLVVARWHVSLDRDRLQEALAGKASGKDEDDDPLVDRTRTSA